MAPAANDKDQDVANKLKNLSTDETTGSDTGSQNEETSSVAITSTKSKKRVKISRAQQRWNRKVKHYRYSEGIDDLVSEVSSDGIIIITERNWDGPRTANDVKVDWSRCRTEEKSRELKDDNGGNGNGNGN